MIYAILAIVVVILIFLTVHHFVIKQRSGDDNIHDSNEGTPISGPSQKASDVDKT